MNYWSTEGKRWGKFELHTEQWNGPFWVLKHERIEQPKWAADAVRKHINSVKCEERQAHKDQARYRIDAKGSGPDAHIARKQVEWWDCTGKELFRNNKLIMACRLWLAEGEPSRFGEPPPDRQISVLEFVFASNSGEFHVPQGIEQPEGMYSELAEPFRFMNAQVTHDRLIGYKMRILKAAKRDQLMNEVFPEAQLRTPTKQPTHQPSGPKQERKAARWGTKQLADCHKRDACIIWDSYTHAAKLRGKGRPEFKDCWAEAEVRLAKIGVVSWAHLRAIVRTRAEVARKTKTKNDAAKRKANTMQDSRG